MGRTIKKVREVYCLQAPIPPNFMKFGVRGHLTDIIPCVKFLVNRFRSYRGLTPQKLPFPILTCCVAVTTVYAMPCVTMIFSRRYSSQRWRSTPWRKEVAPSAAHSYANLSTAWLQVCEVVTFSLPEDGLRLFIDVSARRNSRGRVPTPTEPERANSRGPTHAERKLRGLQSVLVGGDRHPKAGTVETAIGRSRLEDICVNHWLLGWSYEQDFGAWLFSIGPVVFLALLCGPSFLSPVFFIISGLSGRSLLKYRVFALNYMYT